MPVPGPRRIVVPGPSGEDRQRRRPGRRAALAVHLITNTALTGATYAIDGGQQLVPAGNG
ncbi:hypothetical protein [Kribbella sp. HUAS MG21]|uniref:SDR family oxidoreductase n=1 Tax=Kribbella sp. HUAS MG21 TaxID=3160966 RepID=A0AAU7TE09_9ACTN